VYPERMRRNLERSGGLVASGRVLVALVEHDLDRHEAYELVQGYAKQAWNDEADFQALLRADPRVRALLTEDDLAALFDHQYHLRAIDTAFERLGLGQTE